MNFYIRIEDGVPVEHPILESNLRQLFPNISFPLHPSPSDVEPLGYGTYDFSQQPNPGTYEEVTEATPVKDAQGIWRQTWEVIPMTPEKVAEKNEELRYQIKMQATSLLTQTDWVELGDVSDPTNPPYLTNKAEFTTYRTALRTIAVNSPITVETWPIKPEGIWSV